jgi:hypothetical protein
MEFLELACYALTGYLTNRYFGFSFWPMFWLAAVILPIERWFWKIMKKPRI